MCIREGISVDLGSGAEVVEGDEIIAEHHSPERTPQPELELGSAHLTGGTPFPIGPLAMTFAEAWGVDGKDGIAAADECRAGLNGRMLALEDLDLAAVVFTAVPMAVEDSGHLADDFPGKKEDARNPGTCPVIELDAFLEPFAAVNAAENPHF